MYVCMIVTGKKKMDKTKIVQFVYIFFDNVIIYMKKIYRFEICLSIFYIYIYIYRYIYVVKEYNI